MKSVKLIYGGVGHERIPHSDWYQKSVFLWWTGCCVYRGRCGSDPDGQPARWATAYAALCLALDLTTATVRNGRSLGVGIQRYSLSEISLSGCTPLFYLSRWIRKVSRDVTIWLVLLTHSAAIQRKQERLLLAAQLDVSKGKDGHLLVCQTGQHHPQTGRSFTSGKLFHIEAPVWFIII